MALPVQGSRPTDGIDDKGVIARLVGVTLVFITVMGIIGYVVTRYPGLLTSDSIAVVNGVAVSVPDERSATESQTYRCRMSKEFVMEPNSTRVASTVTKTACGYENTAGPAP
jgi:hypothetical protein